MSDPAKPKKPSLTDSDIKTSRGMGRRTFLLGTLGGTAALAGCVPTTVGQYTGLTDADTGTFADAAGYGRGTTVIRPSAGYTGRTDADTGAYADAAGYGRRICTDSDGGPYADPAGRGRHC